MENDGYTYIPVNNYFINNLIEDLAFKCLELIFFNEMIPCWSSTERRAIESSYDLLRQLEKLVSPEDWELIMALQLCDLAEQEHFFDIDKMVESKRSELELANQSARPIEEYLTDYRDSMECDTEYVEYLKRYNNYYLNQKKVIDEWEKQKALEYEADIEKKRIAHEEYIKNNPSSSNDDENIW